MNQPLTPPPPPPGSPPPPPAGPQPLAPEAARRLVEPYAITLLIYSVLCGVLLLLGLIASVLGLGFDVLQMIGLWERFPELSHWEIGHSAGNAFDIGWNIVGLTVYGFVAWAALRMRRLEGWTFGLIVTILVMLPWGEACCCCFLGIFLGIWGLVVLLKPDVKAAFVS